MRKLFIMTMLLLLSIAFVGCDSTMTGSSGYDLSDLNVCIDDLVSQNSSAACDQSTRDQLMVEYLQSYEVDFATTGSVFVDSNLEFNSSSDRGGGTPARIRYWFQYSHLPSDDSNNYLTFKNIITAIKADLETINSDAEFNIEGEFFLMEGGNFIFESTYENKLLGEIQFLDLLTPFETVVNDLSSYLNTNDVDTDLDTETLQVVAEDYSVIIVVDVVTSEYQYKVFKALNEDYSTLSDVETMVETAMNGESLTLVPWDID